jgi:FlaA1/EpsC-like NDP-sugar epimerase
MRIHIGRRPGEKLWEELNSDEEVHRTLGLEDYLVVFPALRHTYENKYGAVELKPLSKTYHSSNEVQMPGAEIERFPLAAEIRRRLTGAKAETP